MKLASKILALGMFLLLPVSAAFAQAPTIAAISDVSLNAGGTITVNVVAYDPNGDAITLTSTGPAYATLNAPTTGSGFVASTITLAPLAGTTGTETITVTATANGETDTETFVVTVHAEGTDRAPEVTAPASATVNEGSLLTFTVTANDPNGDAITALTAGNLPTGATFTSNGSYTSGTFSWTPTTAQSGHYDVYFIASNALTDSATTHIDVREAVQVDALPDVTAPATQTVNEGSMVTFTVNATDADGDHVTLTATGVPSGATFVDNGNNTGTFTWTPNSSQSGSYTVTFTGNDGQGGTDVATTVITVNDVTGGGGAATARLLGSLNPHRKFVCVKIEPVNGAFDVRDVTLGSIAFSLDGQTVNALAGKTHVDFECEDDDGDHDDECDSCDDDDEEDCDSDDGDGEDCVATSIHACFSMSDLRDLFGDEDMAARFADATITGTLSTGGAFTATFGTQHIPGNHDKGKGKLHAKATPNPLNPVTAITFTLHQAGHVRVVIYDVNGRLVRRVLDEARQVGDHSVLWDGTDSKNRRVVSGSYFFRIQAREGVESRRVTVLK